MGWLCLEFLLEMKSSPPPRHIQRSGEHPGSNSSTAAVLGQRELSSLLPCPSVSCLSGLLAEWAKRDPSVKKLCCWTTLSQIPGALSLSSFLVLLWGVFLYWVISWRIVAGAQQQHQRCSIFSGLQAAAQLLRNSKPFWQPDTLELQREVVFHHYLCFAKGSSEDAFCGTSALILTVDETSPEVTVAAWWGKPVPRISVSFHCDFWWWWFPKLEFTLCSSGLLQLLLNKNKFMTTNKKSTFLMYFLPIL